ncbi:MAG: cell division ATP-binding protein FtsE [Lachnospiraceae bacterium]|nr:cell division ATP-binding protein FtsE [Lachnospiraceae bacterium]
MIVLENVGKIYRENNSHALEDVSIRIKKGEFVFVVGESGSGKSTLTKLLLRELTPTQGNIYVLNYDLKKIPHRRIPKYRRNIGVVFQDFRLLKDRNVYENVAFAQRIIQVPGREIRRNVPRVLATVGLAGKYRVRPNNLSGGEQQRVAIARALVNKPAILLADEPTGNLDPKTSLEIMHLFEEINNAGTTVIMVTHDQTIVNAMCKRVITLNKGVVISDEENGVYIDED